MTTHHIIGSPSPSMYDGATLGISTFQTDATDKGVAYCIPSPVTGTITQIGVRYGVRTGTPPTYIASIQSISDTTGLPTGTILGGGSPASVTFTPPASTTWDSTYQWFTLSNPLAVTRGDLLAICFEYSSGTVNTTNRSSFATLISGPGVDAAQFLGYYATKTGGTWTRAAGTTAFGVKTSEGSFGFPILSQYTTNTAATTGRRSACKFQFAGNMGDTYQIPKVRLHANIGATGTSCLCKIWNGAGTVLASATIDTDKIGTSAPTGARAIDIWFPDNPLPTLNFGTSYYCGLEVGGGASAVGLRGYRFNDSADAEALGGGGLLCLATYDGTSWTEDSTVRPLMEFTVDAWTEPSGTGSGAIVPVIGNGGVIFS